MRTTLTNHAFRFAAALLLSGACAVLAQAQQSDLLAVLRSDASVQEKSDACRELARVGTAEAVPALAALLGHEHLSHMARYALERIDDPSVDDALRAAVQEVQGGPRLGVIGSLGVRRDGKAVPVLAAFLAGTDAETAQAAARALGNIGTPDAAAALESALPAATGRSQRAVCEGLLRCAEALAPEGQDAAARAIYDRLRALPDAPPQVRTAALRGAIVMRGADGAALVAEAIRSPDDALAAAAIRSAMEVPAPEITAALVAAAADVPPARRGLVLLALADRHEPQVLPTVLEALQHGDAALRLVAIRALRRVGDASCVPVLLEAALGGSDDEAQAALDALTSLQGPAVDEQLVSRLTQATGDARLVLIDLAARRRLAAAADALWRATEDADPAVRIAAWKALGAVLDPASAPQLIARLSAAQSEQEAAALDQALLDIARRAADRDAIARLLTDALPGADAAVAIRLLDALGAIGGDTALKTVAAAARSPEDAQRDAAFRILGQWSSVDAAPVLLELYQAVSDQRLKSRAIRAYVRIARQFDMPAERRADMCRTALRAATREADQRLVLEVLLRYPDAEMQEIAVEAAAIPELKDEAAAVLMAMTNAGVDRDELGRALARAGQQRVQLEILHAEYGAGDQTRDVTAILRQHAKNLRIIFLPSFSYNESLGGDPAYGVPKQLTIQYRIDGQEGQVVLGENAMIVLPVPGR